MVTVSFQVEPDFHGFVVASSRTVDSGGRATIVKGDEDADAIAECFFFCLEESDLLYDLIELSFLWFDMNMICRASNP